MQPRPCVQSIRQMKRAARTAARSVHQPGAARRPAMPERKESPGVCRGKDLRRSPVLTGRHDPIPRHKASKARIANRTARGSGGSVPARRCEARRAGTCHLHRLSNAANDQRGALPLGSYPGRPEDRRCQRVKKAPARRAGAFKVQRRNVPSRDQGALDAAILSQGANQARRIA